MARPTNEVKKHFIGVRLTESEYEKLRENKSEAIRELINESFVKQNISNVKQNDFVPTKLIEQEEINDILKDTLTMIKLSVGEEEMIEFLKDFHDRLESGELQIVNGKLKLGYHEIFEVLNSNEVKGWLKPVWIACEEKGRPNTDGLRAIFKHGAKLAIDDLYGDRQ